LIHLKADVISQMRTVGYPSYLVHDKVVTVRSQNYSSSRSKLDTQVIIC